MSLINHILFVTGIVNFTLTVLAVILAAANSHSFGQILAIFLHQSPSDTPGIQSFS